MGITEILVVLFLIALAFVLWYMYSMILNLYEYHQEVVELLSRTLKQYYKTENIEPVAVNNGIDLVWNPNNEDSSKKRGFISIWYGENANVDTPLKNVKDADILSEKVIGVVEKHLQDRDLGDQE